MATFIAIGGCEASAANDSVPPESVTVLEPSDAVLFTASVPLLTPTAARLLAALRVSRSSEGSLFPACRRVTFRAVIAAGGDADRAADTQDSPCRQCSM